MMVIKSPLRLWRGERPVYAPPPAIELSADPVKREEEINRLARTEVPRLLLVPSKK